MTSRKTAKKIPRKAIKRAPSNRRTKPVTQKTIIDSVSSRDAEIVRQAKANWNGVGGEHETFGMADLKEEGTRIWEPRTKRDQAMYDQGYSTGYRAGKNAGHDEGYRKGFTDLKEATAAKAARYEATTRLISVTGQTLTAQSEILANLSRIIDGASRG